MTDDPQIELVDGRDVSFLLLVDLKGVATIRSKIPKVQAVQWLRTVADSIESGAVKVGGAR